MRNAADDFISKNLHSKYKLNTTSWLTVTRLPPNILSASATSRITRCDWPNFHFRALFGLTKKCVTPVFHDQTKFGGSKAFHKEYKPNMLVCFVDYLKHEMF